MSHRFTKNPALETPSNGVIVKLGLCKQGAGLGIYYSSDSQRRRHGSPQKTNVIIYFLHVFFYIYFVYFRPLIKLKLTILLFMVAFVAEKVDFLYIGMKFVPESLIFNQMWKALRPTKRAPGPT